MPNSQTIELSPGARSLFDFITSKHGLLLDTKQAAAVIGSTPGSLEEMRARGCGLPHVKIGRSVKYRADTLAEFLEAKTVRPPDLGGD